VVIWILLAAATDMYEEIYHICMQAKVSIQVLSDGHADPSKLGCMCTMSCAGKSTASTQQMGLYQALGDGVNTQSHTWTSPISR